MYPMTLTRGLSIDFSIFCVFGILRVFKCVKRAILGFFGKFSPKIALMTHLKEWDHEKKVVLGHKLPEMP